MSRYENSMRPYFDRSPLAERLLAMMAMRVELPPSKHVLAVERYEAVRNHIERPDSPLHGKVACFYPQGSMAIRATIRSRKRDDGYDIDIVAELDLPEGTAPGDVLDLLFEAINGPKGSRYHGMTKRQTRCVTVYYADGMHLDVTASILQDQEDPRRSWIFHAKPEEHSSKHTRKVMNSFAFCKHFNDGAPADTDFATAYRDLVLARDIAVKADAEVHPVPDHSSEEGRKSVKVVALQLLKRNRNVGYQQRPKLRLPPSVLLSGLASELDLVGAGLLQALDAVSKHVLSALEEAEDSGTLIEFCNPVCFEDRFTDRWPENRQAQQLYISDLQKFRGQLAELASGSLSLERMKELMVDMFGERLTSSVMDEYNDELGRMVREGRRDHDRTGRVRPVPAAAAAMSAPSIARPHTFYGGHLDRHENG